MPRSEPVAARTTIARILLKSLALGALLPFLPAAGATWVSYRNDVARIEETIQSGNRQIAHLAATHLESLLRDTDYEARLHAATRAGSGELPTWPAVVRWELVDGTGTVQASNLSPSRRGRRAAYAAELDGGMPLLEGRLLGVGPWIEGEPQTLVRLMRIDEEPRFLVALVDASRLREQLTVGSSEMVDRHVYAVDGEGDSVFYTAVATGGTVDLRSNPPVRMHVEGREGPIRFTSVVSGKERLGFVTRVAPHELGVIVSADAGERVLQLRRRYELLLWALGFALATCVGAFVWTSHALGRPVLLIRNALKAAATPTRGPLAVPARVRHVREHADLVAAFEELSERFHQTEQQLVQAGRASLLGQLASGIAHESGTPLNVIRASAQYSLRKLGPDDSARRDLELIVEQADRITTMIRRLLEFSRPSEPTFAAVELGEVIESCLEMAEKLSRGITVATDLDPQMGPVWADARLLEHAILNLVVNALQAMPEGGRLSIVAGRSTPSECGEPACWICCRIADTGCGIAPEHLPLVMQPFFTTKAHGKGTGLGLAIVERIVSQHGGAIDLASRVGRGTTVTIRLRPAPELTSGTTDRLQSRRGGGDHGSATEALAPRAGA